MKIGSELYATFTERQPALWERAETIRSGSDALVAVKAVLRTVLSLHVDY